MGSKLLFSAESHVHPGGTDATDSFPFKLTFPSLSTKLRFLQSYQSRLHYA